ncbi:hypothetical protein E3P92_03572 [Wallemia ichthyophaga]|uniref:Tropomyosin-2 n=2 Tax=Wallemia ichthyophaga TaxID=245174 RepID=A0A4T0G5H9_WALIC|nr:hypothetical protein E3P91_01323 [Wallemia ichthyophaga]TIA83349.1 hypothetical protein E3P98_00800 [Wallemia ichthyophaga]TIA92311.1 hypothetical protein E3P97_01632 [Wallemia ichthyophaga]TIA94964.1 hypothetical protein E3P96_03965 [Wallemia ichthyophaga]TIA95788.1 hypothetical protein E3P95_03553 [Wallemia ichthyophaga]
MEKIKEVFIGSFTNNITLTPTQKLNNLRIEADSNLERAEVSEERVKKLEQDSLQREQEVQSLQHKLSLAESDNDSLESRLNDLKGFRDEEDAHRTNAEALHRKIALLEDELDNSEKNLKDVTEKLRQVDVKAEHFERQVQRVEQERDAWEKKYEDSQEKLGSMKRELDEVIAQMNSL